MTKICKTPDCSSYSNVNWKPTLNAYTTGATPVTISDSAVGGYIWGDEVSWINLQPIGAGVTVNPTTGVLSGYAWSSVGSWINFSPTSVPGDPAVGVSINSQGQFSGWAFVSGIYSGWMEFDCSSASTCVTTDWRPIPNRGTASPSSPPTQVSSSGSSGGSTPERQAADLKAIWAYNALQSPPASVPPPIGQTVQPYSEAQGGGTQPQGLNAGSPTGTGHPSSATLSSSTGQKASGIGKPVTAPSPLVIAVVAVVGILVILLLIGLLRL